MNLTPIFWKISCTTVGEQGRLKLLRKEQTFNVYIWENLNTLLFLNILTILATFEAGCLIYLFMLLWYVFLTWEELYIIEVMI